MMTSGGQLGTTESRNQIAAYMLTSRDTKSGSVRSTIVLIVLSPNPHFDSAQCSSVTATLSAGFGMRGRNVLYFFPWSQSCLWAIVTVNGKSEEIGKMRIVRPGFAIGKGSETHSSVDHIG